MTHQSSDGDLISVENLKAFFHRIVSETINKLDLKVSEYSEYYIVDLLTRFSKSELLFGGDEETHRDQPLVLLFKKALEVDLSRRIRLLQTIGDKSLITAGCFAESLERKAVGVRYYIHMGENAYSHLSHILDAHHKGEALKQTFEELSHKFSQFVDLLSEMSDKWVSKSNAGIMDLYSRWIKTQNPRLLNKLIDEGIIPVLPPMSSFKQ